jgi:regulator of protease activity HflC (stomatin/prohibitin superfamily)
MTPLTLILILVAAGILLVLLRQTLVARLTVYEYQQAVLYNRGRFQKLLGPGVYWIVRPFQTAQVIDTRSRAVSIPGQEVLSADNVSAKISVAVRFRVASPEAALASAQSFEQVLYLEAQLILRSLVAALPIEELLQKREQISAQLRERLEPRAAELGLTLETVGVKDIMFPGGLKQIFAQVVEARKSAQAALEKARGETATLRSLANAARLLEGNPALVTLKTLQAASDGRHTLVLGFPQPVIPVSRSGEPKEPGRTPPPILPTTEEPTTDDA